MAINNPININDFCSYEYWLDKFAAFKSGKWAKDWLDDKEKWYDNYFVMDEIEILYIFNKKTGSIIELKKEPKDFVIDFKKISDKKLFRLGNFELIKKVEEEI